MQGANDKLYWIEGLSNRHTVKCNKKKGCVRTLFTTNEASMPLQEWVSNDANVNSLYNVVVPETQSVLGLSWNPITDGMNVVVGDKLDQEASWRYTKRSILSLVSSIYDPLGWLNPLTVRGKMFFKHCGRRKGIGMRNLILIK